ncbi:MAG: PD-(D/E)XK nuclease family protein [Clostridia bacterium]|jgi:ATP-dependent exoDNAse (exonuclease V) beta subunit|nr:PD-(D/E)XK nuclease family protein [Clostridia bacterium]MDD3397883.1 PD-(D/E)XK nuclease family protein [Clostridia bacterium]
MEINKDTLLMFSKFNDYLFHEEPHEYYWKDKRVKTSVTKFVSTFFEEFDKEKISLAYAKKNGLDQQEVLNTWAKTANIASITGTILHKYAEDRQIGRVMPFDFSDAEKNNVMDGVKQRIYKLCDMYDKFAIDTSGKLLPLKMEFTVGLQDHIAGNIDLLCWNEKYQEINIVDYKTSKKIEKTNSYGKKMKYEMSAYDDCEFYHYSLQLSIYKEILNNFGINVGKCILVWINENNTKYEVIQCADLQKEAKMALTRLCNE